MSTNEYKDINNDEFKIDRSTPQREAHGIVEQAKRQAAKIINAAQIQAKQIIAQARAEGRFDDDESAQNTTAGRKWVYNKEGLSMIIEGETPAGWYDEPQI